MKLGWVNVLFFFVAGIVSAMPESALPADVKKGPSKELFSQILGAEDEQIFITGEIDRETVSKAISIADKSDIRSFYVDSGGGDIEAAMELGRYLRRKEADIQLDSNTCASACLFVLAGAVKRQLYIGGPGYLPLARIGVHRPYIARSSSSASGANDDYTRTNKLIKKYLEEMNIPVSLLDLMNSVSPDSVKWLKIDEVDLYFPKADPVWLDLCFSRAAEKEGISKREYIKRAQIGKGHVDPCSEHTGRRTK